MQRISRGFTIVELLIVIVVIAILASITIVSYNGIQGRAKNVQLLSAMDAYEKALRLYMIEHNGQVPLTNIDGGSTYYSVCLGDKYPATDGFNENSCVDYPYIEDTSPFDVRPAVNDAFRAYMQTLPDVHDSVMAFTYSGNSYRSRGISYVGDISNVTGAYTGTITYQVAGDKPCGRGTKTLTTDYGAPMTMCQIEVSSNS